jgi:spermidine synthase
LLKIFEYCTVSFESFVVAIAKVRRPYHQLDYRSLGKRIIATDVIAIMLGLHVLISIGVLFGILLNGVVSALQSDGTPLDPEIPALSSSSSSTSTSAPSSKRVLSEYISETGFSQSLQLENAVPLFHHESQYQTIEVHENRYYGKILVLDGVLQLTERDASAYNEMLAHVPLMQHPNPQRVLVIGGGDGYVVSEVLKHPSVEHVDHVDLDGDVITTCEQFFAWGSAWKDPRVHLHIGDGAAFVREIGDGQYDVVIQDSSDPTAWDEEKGEEVDLPSGVLYSTEHFNHIYRILKPNGIFTFQGESLQIPNDFQGLVEWRQQALEAGFASVRYGSIIISSYPTGQIGFLMCEKSSTNASAKADIVRRYTHMCESVHPTLYYHPRLQTSAFDLPLWAEQAIYGADRTAILPDDDAPTCNAHTTESTVE